MADGRSRQCYRAGGTPKTAHLTRALAVDTCEAAGRQGVRLRPYRCGRCGAWHVATDRTAEAASA